MAVQGLRQGGVATLTNDIEKYQSHLKNLSLTVSKSTIQRAIKGTNSEVAFTTALKTIKGKIDTELTNYMNEVKRSISGVEAEYKRSDSAATAINSAVRKS